MAAAIPTEPQAGARRSPPSSGRRAAPSRAFRWTALAGGAAAAAALLSVSGLSPSFAAAAGAWQRTALGSASCRNDRSLPLVATQGGTGGHNNAGGITLIRPRAQGFKPDDEPTPQELQPVVPGSAKQKYNFFEQAKSGYSVSEVFMRFEGVTPWKRVGEIASETGDYEEAVRAQWPLLVEHSYYLFRKVRFWLPTEHPIQFGFADEEAQIVHVEKGPLPEGLQPLELKGMLRRSGFLGADKPKHWQHMHSTIKDLDESKKDHHKKKPHLPWRQWNQRVANQKKYDPKKYKGTYTQYVRGKRGLVVGTGPSR